MKRCILALAIAVLALASSAAVHAQAIPAASRPGLIEFGATYSTANSDEYTERIAGGAIFATFDFTPHLGVEANVSLLTFSTPQDFGEQSYMIGPRYVYRIAERFEPYLKLQGGIGKTVLETSTARAPGSPGTYFAYQFGGGLDIRIPYNFSIRAIDYSYQIWPGFQENGLSPSIVSFGVAYRMF